MASADSSPPRLTVVTANYNHGHLIASAIGSVARQTRPVFEHIVVDDGSTDDSVDAIRGLQRSHPNLRLFTSECNAGPAAAVARGLREAGGEFVMFLSADDTLLPTAAESLLRVVDRDPSASIVTGDVRYVSVQGRNWRRNFIRSSEPRHFSPAEIVWSHRRGRFLINGASTMARRDAVMRAAIADPELRWHTDWFAFNILAYRFGLWYVPSVINEFRVAGTGYSAKSRDWAQQSLVLDRVFALLASPAFSDVRPLFREGGALAYLPLLMRYMMRNPGARYFLTRPLAANLVLTCGYRAASRVVPREFLEMLVRVKMRSGPADDAAERAV